VIVNTKSQGCDPRVATALRSLAYFWVPSIVAVVGPPIIVEERITLEACGEVGGQVMPFETALAAIGLNLDQAKIMALTRATERPMFFSTTEDGLAEFERWGFKMFRIPGGPEKSSDKLPMLDGRGTKTPAGQLNPVRVFSETFSVVNVTDVEVAKIFAKTNAKLLAEALRVRKIAFAKRVGTTTADVTEFTIDGIGKVGTFKQFTKFRSDLAGKRFDQTGRDDKEDKELAGKTAADAITKALHKTPLNHFLVVVNHGFHAQSSGFVLDLNRGIVHFKSVQGSVFKDGVALDTDAAFLAGVPQVDLVFAHTLKPSLRDQLHLAHRYHSVWVRQKDGKVVQIAAVPPGTAPKQIESPELQQINGLDGSNKGVLDTYAASLAAKVLTAPKFQAGFTATFGRPVPALCTGQATSVRFFTDKERPRVEVRVGGIHPLATAPGLRTRAFGVPSAKSNTIESVITPRGLS
jgi:hypothetical protein